MYKEVETAAHKRVSAAAELTMPDGVGWNFFSLLRAFARQARAR